MPFKFHLKRSRQYNVFSKSLFVISVDLLDSNTMECTLSAESTGRECLQNVFQRLGLHQPEFFGLRYISRRIYPKYRWVDLDRPLKKQLDKHAQESSLTLGLMYYISDVNLLKDEVTRYYYFLQLKLDIIECRIHCNVEQAISLASYSLQAEFGDYDAERHTSEYLKEFTLLPKDMITSEEFLDSMLEPLVQHYASLLGFPTALAEIYYIMGAQQLDGYGQECFIAKDDSGRDVLVGCSTSGIVIRNDQGQPMMFYRWTDIINLIQHKKSLGIEVKRNEKAVQVYFEDLDATKYIWKLCTLQHTFFKQNQSILDGPTTTSTLDWQTLSCNNRPVPVLLRLEDLQHGNNCNEGRSENHHHLLGGSSYSLNSVPSSTLGQYTASRHSSSTRDLQFESTMHSSQMDINNLRAMLPTYRPAPDYETAVRQKYGSASVTATVYAGAQSRQLGHVYSSQPELAHKLSEESRQFDQTVSMNPNKPETFPLMVQSIHFSTPELSVPLDDNMSMQHLVQPVSIYKPPPPYPSNRTISSSTPDLARQTTSAAQVGGSSPDLVSAHTTNTRLINNNTRQQKVSTVSSQQNIQSGSVTTIAINMNSKYDSNEPTYENVQQYKRNTMHHREGHPKQTNSLNQVLF